MTIRITVTLYPPQERALKEIMQKWSFYSKAEAIRHALDFYRRTMELEKETLE